MAIVLQLLNILLPIGYLLAVLNYLVYFLTEAEWSRDSVTKVAWVVAGVHGLYLLLSTVMFHHLPLADVWEAFSTIAFALTVIYLALESFLGHKSTGLFLLVPPLLFQILSSAFVVHTDEVAEILRSPWFGVHVSTALLGYAAFAIAAVYGLLYLMLHRELKGHRISLVFERLPNLEILATLNRYALLLGWVMLTPAIIVGFIWSSGLHAAGEIDIDPLTDPKILSTVVIWALYGLCIGGRYLLKWPSRRMAVISLYAFVLMVATTLVVNFLLPSFHVF